MAKSEFRALLLWGAGLAVFIAAPLPAHAAECKRKTAGFFLTETAIGGTQRLSVSLRGTPPSLTGAPGDAGRGVDILSSRQKGDCLSCHKVSTLSSSLPQGGIGPALDGIANKYSEGQLRQLLIEPKAYWPGTIMPGYFRPPGSAEASILTASEIEDLVAYMETLK